MRKSLIIGAIVMVIGLGGVWYWNHMQREDSIEYHRRAYVTVRPDTPEGTIRQAYRTLESAGIVPRTTPDHVKREQHRDALVRLGYLQRRICLVSNYDASKIVVEMSQIMAGIVNTGAVWEVQRYQTNGVIVSAPLADLDRIEAAIHRADGGKELK